MFDRFVTAAPSAQNAVDIFAGRWATNVGEVVSGVVSGGMNAFEQDDRPRLAAKTLGKDFRFDGLNILELGPLEAAHTFQLERLGAQSIDAVESNSEAYLKCLVVKELCGLTRSRFHLGDFLQFLAEGRRYDLIFCSGVLYHMAEPLKLIKLVAETTDACFVWTHYVDPGNIPPGFTAKPYEYAGLSVTHYEMEYPDRDGEKFWGGNRPVASWMSKRDLFGAFEHFGLSGILTIRDDAAAALPSVTFTAQKMPPLSG